MKPSTIDMLRAYLMTASLAAATMEAAAIVVLAGFGAPAKAFQSAPCRVAMVMLVIGTVLAIKRLAHTAFRAALAGHHAVVDDRDPRVVSISPSCPKRKLVILHLRFERRLFNC